MFLLLVACFAAATLNGIPPSILAGLAERESNWNIHLVGDNGDSFGLTQVNRRWWPSAVSRIISSDYSLFVSLSEGAKILRYCRDRAPDWSQALACYNAGQDVIGQPDYEDLTTGGNYPSDVFRRATKYTFNWLHRQVARALYFDAKS